MNQNLKKLKDDWEKYLFIASIVFAVFSFAFFAVKMIYSEKLPSVSSSSLPLTPSLLHRSALAFISGNTSDAKVSDPFVIYKVLARYQPKTQNNTGNLDKQQNIPQPKPKKFVTVSYSGWLDSSSGEKIAFVSVLDESTKQKNSYSSSEGTKISKFTLSKIESDYIIITDNTKKDYKIQIHSTQKIQIE